MVFSPAHITQRRELYPQAVFIVCEIDHPIIDKRLRLHTERRNAPTDLVFFDLRL